MGRTGSALSSLNFFWSLGAVLTGLLAAAVLPRFHLRGPLLVWLTPVALYLLWRRFERVAEREAAAITGGAGALFDALPKLAQFNLLGLYWRRFEQRFFPNGTGPGRPGELPAAAG